MAEVNLKPKVYLTKKSMIFFPINLTMNYFNQTEKYEIIPCSHYSAQETKHDNQPLPILSPCFVHLETTAFLGFILFHCTS